MTAADVVVLDGRLVLIVDATAAGTVAALLDTALAGRYRLGLPPLPAAHDVHAAARAAHALAALGVVPHPVPKLANGDTSTGSWITTRQAADLIGITTRAVTKRATAGTLDGRKLGGRWIVRLDTKKAA